jgi:plasmid stabilization system protein ParE
MSFSYRLNSLVQQDLENGYNWYEDKKEGLGEQFVSAVENKIQHIASHPEVYSSKQNRYFREAKVDRFPYTIAYKIYKRKREIYIASVYHTSRHPGRKYRKNAKD